MLGADALDGCRIGAPRDFNLEKKPDVFRSVSKVFTAAY